MDSIVYWNTRGACGKNLLQQIKAGYRGVNPSILILTETKCEKDSKFHCLNRLGFDDYAFVPSIGRSGGLIMAWKSNRADVRVLQTDRRFIHIRCSLVGTTEFLLTTVYAIPNSALKALLWRELSRLSSLISLPWVVIGDLNDILQVNRENGWFIGELFRISASE
ncbi:hypothetical protein K1719_032747 [Acacia pycnantha]|nr:hypothetical protein K1719_032747 [Acacia pycnantha]